MYESFYELKEKPFSLLPDPKFLYLGKKRSTAYAMLEYGFVHQAGFTVVTGEIGSGKTTLIRYLLTQLQEAATIGVISNTHRSFGELLHWILLAYKLEYKGKEKAELHQIFVDFVHTQHLLGHKVVLIVDEAQNMDHETLEQLRVLSNINTDDKQLLQVVLVGQPELRKTLQSPGLEQFAQRIIMDYHLDPLEYFEVNDYIAHRLGISGGDPALFDLAACAIIAYHSRGIPRLINLLCDAALVYGYALQRKIIDLDVANEVIDDKLQGGIVPLEQPPAQASYYNS